MTRLALDRPVGLLAIAVMCAVAAPQAQTPEAKVLAAAISPGTIAQLARELHPHSVDRTLP